MNGAIGLVVALNAEARALMGAGPWKHADGAAFRRSRLGNNTTLIVVRSGMGLENARKASQWLIQEGVAAMGVVGVCGGLATELGPGDLILADAVIQEERGQCRHVWTGDSSLVETVCGTLRGEGLPAYSGPIISVQKPLLFSQEKESLFRQTGAIAVDMESAAAASVAQSASLPFFAFRAVCDASDRSIPDDLANCLQQNGRVRLFFLFQRLILKPALVWDILQMKRDFGAALAALKGGWHRQLKYQVLSLLA